MLTSLCFEKHSKAWGWVCEMQRNLKKNLKNGRVEGCVCECVCAVFIVQHLNPTEFFQSKLAVHSYNE